MDSTDEQIALTISVVNTDNEISELVIEVKGHEIRIPYTELLDKGRKTIRDSFINKGHKIDDETIVKVYNEAIRQFDSIHYMYSRPQATPDVISLNHEYTAQGITERLYNGSQLEQKGSYDLQKEMFERLLNNNVGSIVLAATIAGMVNRVLELEDSQQIIIVVGPNSTGKTTLCKGLGAVFGNRDHMVADNTDLGLERLLGDNQILPLYADDYLVKYMTEKKAGAAAALRKLVMMLSEGRTKSTAVKKGREFSGSFIMTSESSMTDMLVSENSGILGDAYRFIEIPMDRSLFKSADDVRNYNKIMNENRGFLGDMCAEYLMRNRDKVKHKYDELYGKIATKLESVAAPPDIRPARCANRIASLAITYCIAAYVNNVYSDDRLDEFITYLIDTEIEQLSKYRVISLEESFRTSLIEDYAKLDEILGKEYKPVAYTGEKKDARDNDKYSDFDESGSVVVLRMSRETFGTYLRKKGYDRKNVTDMLRANRNSGSAKVVALAEGRSARIDKKCSDLNRRMVVIEFRAA